MADTVNRLVLSSADLSGVRNALLEAVTDLHFADDSTRDQLARDVLAAMDDLAGRPLSAESTTLFESGQSHLRARLTSGAVDQCELILSDDIGDVLHESLEHVLASLMEFELPIRVRLGHADLSRLSRELLRPRKHG